LLGWHLPLQIQGVISKSIDMLDLVGYQATQDGRIHDKPLGLNLRELLKASYLAKST
jgi:hypothetical protein